jgi:hypothetical protein
LGDAPDDPPSPFCGQPHGIPFSFYTNAAEPFSAVDGIAAVITGGMIQTSVNFDGTLSRHPVARRAGAVS